MPLLRRLLGGAEGFERELSILESPAENYVPVRTAETLLERDTAKLAHESKLSLKVGRPGPASHRCR